VEPAVARERTRRTVSEAAALTTPAQTDALQPAVQNYSFEVVGTNVTLKQRVVFTGLLLDDASAASNNSALTNLAQPASNNSVVGNAAQQFSNTAQVQNASNLWRNQGPASNRRITGKALVGTSQELPVEAVPAP
jgi:hypothetical protein